MSTETIMSATETINKATDIRVVSDPSDSMVRIERLVGGLVNYIWDPQNMGEIITPKGHRRSPIYQKTVLFKAGVYEYTYPTTRGQFIYDIKIIKVNDMSIRMDVVPRAGNPEIQSPAYNRTMGIIWQDSRKKTKFPRGYWKGVGRNMYIFADQLFSHSNGEDDGEVDSEDDSELVDEDEGELVGGDDDNGKLVGKDEDKGKLVVEEEGEVFYNVSPFNGDIGGNDVVTPICNEGVMNCVDEVLTGESYSQTTDMRVESGTVNITPSNITLLLKQLDEMKTSLLDATKELTTLRLSESKLRGTNRQLEIELGQLRDEIDIETSNPVGYRQSFRDGEYVSHRLCPGANDSEPLACGETAEDFGSSVEISTNRPSPTISELVSIMDVLSRSSGRRNEKLSELRSSLMYKSVSSLLNLI